MATFMFLTVCPCRCGELTLSARRKGNDRIDVFGPLLPVGFATALIRSGHSS